MGIPPHRVHDPIGGDITIRVQEQTPEDRTLTAPAKGQPLIAAADLFRSEHSQFKGPVDPRTISNPVSVHRTAP